VECFLELGLTLPPDIEVASIGPVTSETILAKGMKIAFEAQEHSIPGLVKAIRKHYA
jgi:uroporphyrinogen III methyltransferase/synthase